MFCMVGTKLYDACALNVLYMLSMCCMEGRELGYMYVYILYIYIYIYIYISIYSYIYIDLDDDPHGTASVDLVHH